MCENGACERYRRLSNRMNPASVKYGGSVAWVLREDRKLVLVRRGSPFEFVQRESKCCLSWMYYSSIRPP